MAKKAAAVESVSRKRKPEEASDSESSSDDDFQVEGLIDDEASEDEGEE